MARRRNEISAAETRPQSVYENHGAGSQVWQPNRRARPFNHVLGDAVERLFGKRLSLLVGADRLVGDDFLTVAERLFDLRLAAFVAYAFGLQLVPRGREL